MDETVGFIGELQQGADLPLVLRTTNAANSPDTPQLNPVAKIYRDGSPPTLIQSVIMAADQQGADTGVFRLALHLTGLYGTVGRYLFFFSWYDTGGHVRMRAGSFTLLPGGSPDGAVIALFNVRRPNAGYLIRQTDSGLLIRGKNPR